MLNRTLFLIFTLFLFSVEGVYINRFSAIEEGAITFTGNTLGLSKQNNQNQPGSLSSNGTFIITDAGESVGLYPVVSTPPGGTTVTWEDNSSSAELDLPLGSTVIYAELIWSGSYGFQGQIPFSAGSFLPDSTSVLLTGPNRVVSKVAPDPATSQESITPGYESPQCGNYVRSQDVTALIQAGGAGKYTVRGVPGTVSPLENTHNSAGWTLAVAYSNGNMPLQNITIFVGCEQASDGTDPAEISGFSTPDVGTVEGRLFVSAIVGEYENGGAQLLFGSTSTLTPADAVSGTNNPIDNFFHSQINTLLPLTTDPTTGKLIAVGSSVLDTRGTYGLKNYPIVAPFPNNFARQGYDITSVDVSSHLESSQTTAYVQGTTTVAGDDYTINALAMQITVDAPRLLAARVVNGQTSAFAVLGDVLTLHFEVENVGTIDSLNTVLTDTLPSGLTFVPGSVAVNAVSEAGANPGEGILIGTIATGDTATVEFQAQVTALPPNPLTYRSAGKIDYEFLSYRGEAISSAVVPNTIEIFFYQTANPDFATTLINTPLNGPSVLSNDIGVDLIVLTNTQGTKGGTVAMSPYGTYVYTPAYNFIGDDTFTYTAVDVFGTKITGNVTIHVVPQSSLYGNDNTYNTRMNVRVSGNVLTNDDISSFTQGSLGGTVVFDQANFTYTPPTGFLGIDTFTYTTPHGSQTVYITVYPNVSITAVPDAAVTSFNVPVKGNVLGNDSGNVLTIVGHTQGTQGGKVVVDLLGNYTYTPPHKFSGIDTFQYTIRDVFGNTASATVTINVNAAPLAQSPVNFRGTIRTCKLLNRNIYSIRATWTASATPGVVAYRIYYRNNHVATIPASGQLVFSECLPSREAAFHYEIAAVDELNNESEHIRISI